MDPAASSKIRIGLLGFEPLRVAGLREIFADRAEFEVAAVDWSSVLREASFDLVILVLRDRTFSMALLGRLRSRYQKLKVIVVGTGRDEARMADAIAAGARGWLDDTASPQQIMHATDVVLEGSIWAPRRVLSMVLDRTFQDGAPTRTRPQSPRFTEREEEVLQQLVLARSNREIAQALSIREQTVKSYVARLMRKVGAGNRIALSVQAASDRWLEIKQP